MLDGHLQRVGGNVPIETDTRVLAATNVELEAAVENGSFRRDLYYRIRVLSIEIAPLSERHEDILLLAEHFLNVLGTNTGAPSCHDDASALRHLCAHA